MNISLLSNLVMGLKLTAATTFLLGLFVLLKKNGKHLGLVFFFYCLTLSWWSSLEVYLLTSTNSDAALFWGRSMMAGVVFTPTLLIHFISNLLSLSITRWKLMIFYSISLCFSLLSYTPYMVTSVERRSYVPFMISPGFLYFPMILFYAALAIYAHIKLYKAYRSSSTKRRQMGYLFWSSIFGYMGGAANFLLVFDLKVPILNDYGTYAVPLYVAATTYAIVRYQLMDIRTVIHKTVMWITTSSLVLVPIGGIFYFNDEWIKTLPSEKLSVFVMGVMLLLIPYFKLIQPRIDHLFQRRNYDMQKILQGMVRELAALKNLDELVNKIANTIQEALYVSKMALILWDDKEKKFKLVKGKTGEKENEDKCIAFDDPFIFWMKEQDCVIESEEIELNPDYELVRPIGTHYFKRFAAKIALPLVHNNKLIGLVNLGEKDNLKPFTKIDVDFLSNLRAEASIALSNSLLYDDVSKMSEELRQWAIELEHKVEDRTRELAESKRQLEESYQKLQELDQLKTKFFANISHELRTPLTLILAPTEMMLNRTLGDINSDQKRYLEIMQTNIVRLLKLINTLLDLAKLDAGKMEVYYHRTDFIKFANGVVNSVSPMAEKKSLVLSFQGDNSLPEMFFDPDKIEKVVLNLVFNALKFTDVGEIRVACVKDGDCVLVKVSDTGIGIPKDHMSKLFNRFSQADSSASRKYEGTGIGLALAKELVELHHGKIWAESEEGRGTTFIFTLPIYTRLEDVPGALDRRREAVPVDEDRRKEDWSKSVLKVDPAAVGIVRRDSFPKEERVADDLRHRILIVDDNPDMLSHIAMQLKEDYQLLYAKDGREGVDRAMSEIPHLIISDVMMPYKDGHQLCKETKENPRTCHIPVILLTARTDLSNKIEGLERGADDYLTKPFNSQELRARVRSLLSLRRLEREIQLRSQELEVTLQELKETQSQLVQSEKMAALGLLVAGVAHEINNPISFAKGSVGTVKRALEEMKHLEEKDPAEAAELFEDIRESVDIIKNGLERTETIVHNLKSFVRKDEGFFKQFDLHAGLDSTLQLFQHDLTYKIKVNRDYGKVGPIEAIPGQLNQAFMNIIQNAIHAINGKGEIFIKTDQVGSEVTISIRDTGCGILEKDLPHIFDPFFTTKEVGKGTGLGMTITYKIIERHHGKIEIKSQVGAGTEVRIVIPTSQSDKNQSVQGGLYAGSAPV